MKTTWTFLVHSALLMASLTLFVLTTQAQEKPDVSEVERSVGFTQERFGVMPVKIDSALTKHFPNAIVYRDSLGRVSFRLKIMPDLDFDPAGRVLMFENGSPYANKGSVMFDGLTKEELEFILAQMEFYRTRKKVRHD